MSRTFAVTHSRDRNGRPIVSIDSGFPGLYATLTPNQLRQMARQLVTMANDADQGARGAATYVPDAPNGAAR